MRCLYVSARVCVCCISQYACVCCVLCVDVSPDGRHLVTSSKDVWRVVPATKSHPLIYGLVSMWVWVWVWVC